MFRGICREMTGRVQLARSVKTRSPESALPPGAGSRPCRLGLWSASPNTCTTTRYILGRLWPCIKCAESISHSSSSKASANMAHGRSKSSSPGRPLCLLHSRRAQCGTRPLLLLSPQVSEMMLKKYLAEAQQHTFMTLVQVRTRSANDGRAQRPCLRADCACAHRRIFYLRRYIEILLNSTGSLFCPLELVVLGHAACQGLGFARCCSQHVHRCPCRTGVTYLPCLISRWKALQQATLYALDRFV